MNWFKKVHKWASVIIGIQLLLWLISGFYFNVMDHRKAAGRTYFSSPHSQIKLAQHNIEHEYLIEPKEVLLNNKSSTSLALITLLNKPYYLLTHDNTLYRHLKNSYDLIDAYTGDKLLIDESLVVALAKQSYNGAGELGTVTHLLGSADDFPKQQNTLWQINFTDEINTSVYIEAETGRLIGHSDDEKRFADFFFMLHFMDYGQVGSFNTIQSMIFAFICLWLCLTGVLLTITLLKRGKYKIILQ